MNAPEPAQPLAPVPAPEPPVTSSVPPTAPPDEPFVRMSMGDHLDELRGRVIRALVGLGVGMGLAVYFGQSIFKFLTRPLYVALKESGYPPYLIQLNPTETVLVYFKTCLMVGLILSAPYGLWQLWRFVASGLYASEQRYVKTFAPLSMALFAAGVLFFFYVVLPITLVFLVNFTNVVPRPDASLSGLEAWVYKGFGGPATLSASAPAHPLTLLDLRESAASAPTSQPGQFWVDGQNMVLQVVGPNGQIYGVPLTRQDNASMVSPQYRLSEYLEFVTWLALVFGLTFQMPMVVVFLVLTGLISVERLQKWRKYVIFIIFILAAVITPTTDPFTMLLLAVPMIGLFEGGLWLTRFISRNNHATPDPSRDSI